MKIDEKIKQGYDKEIAGALAKYFKVEPKKLKVKNDHTSDQHTLVTLSDVDGTHPKIKMRLTELERHEDVDILNNGQEDGTVELRVFDSVIEELVAKYSPDDQ